MLLSIGWRFLSKLKKEQMECANKGESARRGKAPLVAELRPGTWASLAPRFLANFRESLSGDTENTTTMNDERMGKMREK